MEQIIISGFGGQGALFVGKLLAYAGMTAGKYVSWIPSYGPEMRGGTANCSVIISEKEITSPIVSDCSLLLALNEPSVEKFMSKVKPGGSIVLNESIIKSGKPAAIDADWVSVPTQEIAEKLGNPQLMNMIMLGAALSNMSLLSYTDLFNGMEEMMGNKPKRLAENLRAIEEGMTWYGQVKHDA